MSFVNDRALWNKIRNELRVVESGTSEHPIWNKVSGKPPSESRDSQDAMKERIAQLEKKVAELSAATTPVLPLLHRDWIQVAVPETPAHKWITFAHMNILADGLAQTGGFDARTPPALLDWSVRKDRLRKVLAETRADILGISEASPHLMEASAYVQKTPEDIHGVALSWKSHVKMHVLVKVEKIVAALVALFEVNGTKVWVAVTHLKAKAENENIRISQMHHISSILRGLVVATPAPVVLMGDFNAQADAPCMAETTGLGLRQVGELPWTTWKHRPAEGVRKHEIDTMWASPVFALERYLDVPDDESVEGAGLLPGTRYPSDHLAIACTLRIQGPGPV